MDYLDIAFLDPKQHDLKVCSHVDLETLIEQIKGKHCMALGNELRQMFAAYLRNGCFGFSTDAFDHIHNAYVRRQLTEILAKCSTVVKNYSSGHSVIKRKFKLKGVVKKPTTYSRCGGSRLVVVESRQAWRTLPAEWLTWKYKRWCAYCTQHGLVQNLDIGGSTEWGAATLDALDSVSLPARATTKHAQGKIDKLTSGVLRMVKRTRKRMYHCLTNLPKEDRRKILIDGNQVGEIDMTASYVTLITSLLPKEIQDPILAKIRADKWYAQFTPVYDQWQPQKAALMRTEGLSEDEIADRFSGGVKAEFQRQCFFWHDPRDRPLWDVLVANHSALANLIDCLHRKYKPSGLSDILTRAEAALFVDDAIPELAKRGVKCIGIHDGLIATIDNLDVVRRVLERLGVEHLGFVPSFKSSIDGQDVRETAKECVAGTSGTLMTANKSSHANTPDPTSKASRQNI